MSILISKYLNELYEASHEYKKLAYDGRGGGNIKSYKGWTVTPARQKKYRKKFIDHHTKNISKAMKKFRKNKDKTS